MAMFTDKTESTGTGFFVNDDAYAVTAAHVVKAPGKTLEHLSVRIGTPPTLTGSNVLVGNSIEAGATIIAVDEQHDIAILLPELNPFKTKWSAGVINEKQIQSDPVAFAQLDARRLKDGEDIFVTGFPLAAKEPRTTSGHIASTHYEASVGMISFQYVSDIHVNFGNSGGPVFSTKSHSVIGICQAYEGAPIMSPANNQPAGGVQPGERPGEFRGVPISQNSGLAEVIPAEYVVALLNSARLKFSVKSTE